MPTRRETVAILRRKREASRLSAHNFAVTSYAETMRSVLGVKPALRVEILDYIEAATYEDEWKALAGRSLERNVFYDPAFALACAQHLPEAGRPSFAFIFSDDDSNLLLGIFPFTVSRLDLGLPLLRGWSHNASALGTPLVDATRADNVISAFFEQMDVSGHSCMLFAKLPVEGAFTAALQRFVKAGLCSQTRLRTSHRAILRSSKDGADYFRQNLPGKKHREFQRLLRRLSEIAPVEYRSLSDARSQIDALERFLQLEAKGWKGVHGSALVQDAARATFARAAARALAESGQISFEEFYCGETLIASGILMRSGSECYFWKIAHDEEFARFSPGVLLTLEMSERLLLDRSVTRTDSCAVEGHPMIDRLWRDRLETGDYMVSTSQHHAVAFEISVRYERFRHWLRETARNLYIRLRRAKNN